ncbi:MAG: PAS domain-containing protein, partial [Myxococcota bacterium]
MSDLERRLRATEAERDMLARELRKMQEQLEALSRPAAAAGGERTRRRRVTENYERVGGSEVAGPGVHNSSVRPRRSSDVVAIVPDRVDDAPFETPVALGQQLVEDQADFDAGQVRRLDEASLDALPYGLVVVDSEGRVLLFNDTESRFVGLSRTKVVGRNFFRDIAPCTRVQQFEGRFREFVQQDNGYGVETFDF